MNIVQMLSRDVVTFKNDVTAFILCKQIPTNECSSKYAYLPPCPKSLRPPPRLNHIADSNEPAMIIKVPVGTLALLFGICLTSY